MSGDEMGTPGARASGSTHASGGARAQPFYCPYCGEQDIRPGEEHGTYHCRTCDRLWRLEYRRLGGGS